MSNQLFIPTLNILAQTSGDTAMSMHSVPWPREMEHPAAMVASAW